MTENLLIKYINRQCNLSELKEVEAFISADEENKTYLFEMERIWRLKDEKRFSDPRFVDEKYRLLMEKLQKSKRKGKIAAILIPALKYAATVAIIVLLAANLYYRINDVAEKNITTNTIEVPSGQRVKLTLGDGSRVWLNAQTKFTYPEKFGRKERRVELDGEGYFEIAHDASRPFKVQTSQYSVTALGTTFDVYAYSGSTAFETILIEGVVEVADTTAAATAFRLQPGCKLYYDDQTQQMKTNKVITKDYISWIDGVYYFNDIAFAEMAKRLEHYYKTKIVINDPAVRNYRGTGKFRQHESIGEIMNVVKSDIAFSYTFDKDCNILTIDKYKKRI